MLTDPAVRKYLCDDQVIPLTQTTEILAAALDAFAKHQYGLWLVYPNGQREPAGFAGLYTFFDEPQPQLLYALLPQYQGRGFATEASRRIVRYAFAQLGYSYLVASCDPPNAASVRVMERLGMQWLKEERAGDKPVVFYHLTREQYLSQYPPEPAD
jgi:ribosomal-protein-alanine N-acetyltransferase